jgi:squalene-hopene/tetraprenyl-beta-curcumene cyclase
MTCLALMAFKEMNTNGKYDKVIGNASKFVMSLQDNSDMKDVKHGGVGYDGKSRPDLSNTQFMVEALIAAGVSKDDPAIKKALVFISRCQNLKSEYNDQPFATKTTDDDKGGFVYNPLDQDNDKSEKRTPEGGLRSEGGMTYAGLKSFLYSGVSKDDPRVKAAITWVRKHYSVTENPGQKQSGLFYYYHTFAKAMDALGEDPFVDAKGVKHDWKQELFDELKKKQADNGSWANTNRAFLEDVPELATAFALLSLSYTKKK